MAARWESDALPTEHLLVPRTRKKQFVHNPYPREVEIRGEQSWSGAGGQLPELQGRLLGDIVGKTRGLRMR